MSEFWIVFTLEFRRQLLRKGHLIFSGLLVGGLLTLFLLLPLAVTKLESASHWLNAWMERQFETPYGYVDELGIIPVDVEGPPRYSDAADGIAAVVDGGIDVLFVIPADFARTGKVTEYWTAENRRPGVLSNDIVESEFIGFLKEVVVAEWELPPEVHLLLSITTMDFVVSDVLPDTGYIEDESALRRGTAIITGFGINFLLILSVSIFTTSLVRSVIEEKQTRMVEILLTSAPPTAVLSGKLVGYILATMIHGLVWYAFAAGLLIFANADAPLTTATSNIVITLGCWILGVFMFMACYIFAATVAESVEGVAWFNYPVTLVTSMVVPGIVIFSPPEWMGLTVMTYIPPLTPTVVLMRQALGAELSTAALIPAFAGVAVAIVAILWLSSRVYTGSILLAGQSLLRPRAMLDALRSR